jgi:hypothetical protein
MSNINRVKIRQYVHFPNGHEQDFVIDSTTKASELVSNICRELRFIPSSANGLSLYLETGKKRKIYSYQSFVFILLDVLQKLVCQIIHTSLIFSLNFVVMIRVRD